MKRNISEDLPARQHPPSSGGKNKKPSSNDKKELGETSDERIKKALNRIRYIARTKEIPLLQVYTQYTQNSSMTQQERMIVKKRLFGKDESMKAENFNIQDFASLNVANALYKVFVEKVQHEDPIILTYMEKLENNQDRKYIIEVTGIDGNSYVRHATRSKISQLRLNPNIESVKMVGEEKKNKPKRWWDDDGDGIGYEKGEVSGKFKRKKNVKEEFIDELVTADLMTGEKEKEIDVMKGKNVVNISPNVPGTGRNETQRLQMAHYDMSGRFVAESENSNGYEKFLDMLQEKKMTKKDKEKEKALKAKYDKSGMKASMMKQYGPEKGKDVYFAKIRGEAMKEESECEKSDSEKEIDPRKLKTMKDRTRTALGLMGIKSSYEPEGEILDETKLGDKARKIERQEAQKGGLRRTRTKREKQASNLAFSQSSDDATLERQKAPKDTGLHKGATRPNDDDEEKFTRRRRRDGDDHPSLSARERNPGLR